MTPSSGITSQLIIDLMSIAPGSLLDVETSSRHYRIECMGGNEVRISGHPEYCPEPVPAWIQGSINSAGILEPGLIERGARLAFHLNNHRPVTTSRVLRVRVARPS